MSITVSQLTSGQSGTNSSNETTASISPSSNALLLAFVLVNDATPDQCTLSGNGLTWVEVADITLSAVRGFVFRAQGASPSSGGVTIDFGGLTQSTFAWAIGEATGAEIAVGNNGADAVVQSATASASGVTGLTVNLLTFTHADNATYGAFGHQTSARNFTPGTGFTELGEIFAGRGCTEWRNDSDITVDVSITGGTATNLVGLALEVGRSATLFNQSVAGTTTPAGALIRQPGKRAAGTTTPAAALGRSPSRRLAATVTPAAAVARLVSHTGLGGTTTPAGSLLRRPGPLLAGSVASSGVLARSAGKRVAGTVTPAASLSTSRVVLLALSGAVSAAGALARFVGRTVTGSTSPAGATINRPGIAQGGAVSPAGVVVRRVGLVRSGTVAQAGAVVKLVARLVSGATAPVGALRKMVLRLLAGALELAGGVTSDQKEARFGVRMREQARLVSREETTLRTRERARLR